MDNENTILDPQYNAENTIVENTTVEQPKNAGKKNIGWGEKAAYAAGGAVVGAGATMAGQAVAAPKAEKIEQPETNEEDAAAATASAETATENATADNAATADNEVVANAAATGVTVEANGTTVHVNGAANVDVANGNVHVAVADTTAEPSAHVHAAANFDTAAQTTQAAPDPEEAIVATATGVRVAQVSDDMSFSQAFADARAQVGPGGVFEWHGRAYGTYYKDEWDQMTPAERAEYQASIDYNDVLSDSAEAQHHNDVAQHNAHESNAHQPSHSSSHHSSHENHQAQADPAYDTQNVETDDVDVRVLEVGQTDLNEDGIPENAAVLEISGRQVLIVDVDQDGTADAAFRENNGEIEGADLSGQGIPMPNQSDGDAYMAQADSAPDYMNDANVGMYEA